MDTENKYGNREVQEKLLEILLYFHSFCTDHHLNYTLAGGTLLGAARHQGFIPWDDDVDVFMLREDYENLAELWDKYADQSRYSLVRSDDKVNIHHSATEIKDNHTTFINKHSMNDDIHHGLMIDVLPLDDVPANGLKRTIQTVDALVFCCFNFQRLPEHKGKLTYRMTKTALNLVRSLKTRYRIWKHAENNMIKLGRKGSGQVASLVEGMKILKERFPREWFENPVTLPFEGVELPVPRDYHQWLTVSYGDYMTPVPEEERVPRHTIVFSDMNHSYKDYKGIYYCVKEK